MDALQITFFPVQEGKNLFPAFEKIKSIFDNSRRGPESSTASSQQALLLDSPFNRKEATISNKAAKMHPYSRIARRGSTPRLPEPC